MNKDWTLLSNEGFDTIEKAQRFLRIMGDQHFGSGKETVTSIPEELQFRIIQKKDKFYIEYNLLEKHTL